MRFTPDMISAFEEWLECDRIRRAFITAYPDIAICATLDPYRPMLRIVRSDGYMAVARTVDTDTDTSGWVVAHATSTGTVLHDVNSAESATELLLLLMDEG